MCILFLIQVFCYLHCIGIKESGAHNPISDKQTMSPTVIVVQDHDTLT